MHRGALARAPIAAIYNAICSIIVYIIVVTIFGDETDLAPTRSTQMHVFRQSLDGPMTVITENLPNVIDPLTIRRSSTNLRQK